MKVIVKKQALEQLVKTLAEERSFHSRRYDQIAGEDKPVLPDAQVAHQLSAEQVPVSNPDFLPVNKKQLSAAASQLASQVSPDMVQKFYTGLKKLIRKTAEPKQYKGMSETDLMEALRPFVIREALRPRLLSFSGQGEDGNEEEPASPETLNVPKPTRAGRTSAEIAATKKSQRSVASTFKGALEKLSTGSRLTSKEIEILKGNPGALTDEQKLSLDQAIKKDVAIRSIKAIEASNQRMLDNQSKVDLSDLVIGDASSFLDLIRKKNPNIEIPESFEDAKINITTSQTEGQYGPKIEVVLTTPLLDKPAKKVHDGGPIPYTDSDGNDGIYYLTDPFPFDQNTYLTQFKKDFAEAVQIMKNKEAKKALKKSRKRKEPEEIDEKERKKREDTIRKKLSKFNASEMAFELFEKLEDLRQQNNKDKISDIFNSLRLSVSGDQYINMSEEEKIQLKTDIANAIEAQRRSFYDISHMDYVRNIIDLESFEAEYSKIGDVISSSDPTAIAEENLFESFFEKCFKPLFEEALDTIFKKYPEVYEGIAEKIYKMSSYQEFVGSLPESNKNAWRDMINKISSDAIIDNPKIFSRIIADFYPMYAGVKGKQGTEAYDERLAAIGMSEIGRQREAFEHIRSPIALMKAVTTSAMLEFLDPEESDVLEKSIMTPEKIKKNLLKFLKSIKDNFVAAQEILDMPVYGSSLKKSGYKNAFDLAAAPTEDIMSSLEESGTIEKLEKAARVRPLEIEGMREYLQAVVKKFIEIIGNYFKKFTETEFMSKRGPIYDYMSDYAISIEIESPEEDESRKELMDLILDYTEKMGVQVATARKEAKKAGKGK